MSECDALERFVRKGLRKSIPSPRRIRSAAEMKFLCDHVDIMRIAYRKLVSEAKSSTAGDQQGNTSPKEWSEEEMDLFYGGLQLGLIFSSAHLLFPDLTIRELYVKYRYEMGKNPQKMIQILSDSSNDNFHRAKVIAKLQEAGARETKRLGLTA